MLTIRRYIISLTGFLLLVLCLAACSRPAAVAELDAADSLMERRPDSALALLRRVDTLRLTSAHDRARYAMLLSVAQMNQKDFAPGSLQITPPIKKN